MYDVVIIGAGASGCFCALTLKYNNPNLKVLLLEKNDKLGKKILITGNGRCNLGNTINDIENYNSESSLEPFKEYLKNNNYNLNNEPVSYLDYLMKFGVLVTNESERLYPYSNQASTVCKSFERALKSYGVDIKYNFCVNDVSKSDDNFYVNENIKAKNIVIATGGKTYTKTGSDGSGYKLLKKLGHNITKTYPSLTSLKTSYRNIKDLAGVRVNGEVSLLINDKIVKKEIGQVQFTKDSLSGICVFNLSRNVGRYLEENNKVSLELNLVSDYTDEELKQYIKGFSDYTVSDALTCLINNKVACTIAKDLHLENKIVKELSETDLNNICRSLKQMSFEIISTGDYEMAQVTAGGAKLEEFNEKLKSKNCDGLYAIGEVLDVDGKCGGYNLSWAFNSALITALEISKK